jgi:hypothetical protein
MRYKILVALLMLMILPLQAIAISQDDLGSVLHRAELSDPNDQSCVALVGGPGGSGPLYGPKFPKVSDTADLAQRLKTYIQNTIPSSPLAGYTNDLVALGQKYDVNPALAVAQAQKETGLGTVGYGPAPKYNIWNVRNGAAGSFGNYTGVKDAIESYYKLLSGNLYLGAPSNFTTVGQIITRFAPPSENDTAAYITFVQSAMHKMLDGISTNGQSADNPAPSDSSLSSGCNNDNSSQLGQISGDRASWAAHLLTSPNIKLINPVPQKFDITHSQPEGGVVDNTVRLLYALAQAGFDIPITALRSDHHVEGSGDGLHNPAGAAVDIGYNAGDPTGTKIYKWVYDHRQELHINMMIWNMPPSGYQCVGQGKPVDCYGFFGAATMSQHANHIHVGVWKQ